MSSNIIGYCLTSMNSNHRNNLFKTLTGQEKDSLKKKTILAVEKTRCLSNILTFLISESAN